MIIKLSPEIVRYRGIAGLLIRSRQDKSVENILKSLPGIYWSSTNQAWFIPYDLMTLKTLENRFRDIVNFDFSKVESRLKEETQLNSKSHSGISPQMKKYNNLTGKIENSFYPNYITKELEEFQTYLKHKRYSGATIRTYMDTLRQFLNHIAEPVSKISNKDLITYNRYLLKCGYSNSYQNQVASSLKLFFSRIYNKKFDIEKIERPRREHKLPNVLSKQEIKQLLSAPYNLKHRAMLSLIYACGLRRSELLNLKPSDIESSRGLIVIRQGKGRKDRVVPLPGKILDSLRSYYRTYRPVVWLFEGQTKGNQYSATSLAKVLKNATDKAKIKKPVSLHWLRHSYATHLLEQGTDLRIIQELLGHQNSKTTEIYTHVSTKCIQQIKSPFEDIDL